jgi:tRNA dimethylallyltransferase
MTEDEAVERAQTGHRNYSKRQGTWFRRDPRIHWLNGFGGDRIEEALRLIGDTGD